MHHSLQTFRRRSAASRHSRWSAEASMASQAQCFYCFECLSASFENRHPPALSKVEGLWEQFQTSLQPDDEPSSEIPEGRPSEEDSTVEDAGDTDGEESQGEDDEDGIEHESTNQASTLSTQPDSPRPQLPSISRLRASKSSSQSSSCATTPSTLSANSSKTALTTPASSTTSISTSPSTRSYPLFVTWNTLSHRTSTAQTHKSLRGCIGTFDPLPLSSGLQTYALTSAFEDTRFSPIPPSLLPSLSCNITLLADFETCTSPLDWELGTHGLRISFIYRGKRYGATYLPDVAVDQEWSKEETLDSLMRKAGWDGGGSSSGGGAVARRFLRAGRDRGDSDSVARQPWQEVSDFRTTRYTGLKASATYDEWREWRRWVEENHGTVLR